MMALVRFIPLPKSLLRSLKKAIIKYGGKPEGNDDHAYITWTSKKKNDSEASVKLPYVTRKERKGRNNII